MKNFENELNVVAMESGDAYDQMLRGLFESCDTVGLGLLTPRDFERLCKKLSIQEHSSLLAGVLFSETNKRKLLSYDAFRDTLIVFLTGNTDFSGAKEDVCKTGDRQTTDRIEQISPITDDDWNNNFNNNGIENGNDVGEHLMTSYRRTDTVQQLTDAGEPVIVLPESRKTRISPGQQRFRRYGRRSKPDLEILEKRNTTIATERPVVLREVHMDNASKSAGYLDDGSPENSPWKALEVSFISGEPTTPIPSIEQGPIILKEEEFTGEGKDDEWTNPDAEWQPTYQNKTPTKADMSRDSVQAAQSAIETAWRLVVGDPETDAMSDQQLGSLCAELGMGTQISTNDEIEQLFSALDQDNDGLVRFGEFSLQMSTFLGDQPTEQTPDRHADIVATSDNEQELVFSNSVQEIITESTSKYDVRGDVTNFVNDDENMTQPSRSSTPVKEVADENDIVNEIGYKFSSPRNSNSSMDNSNSGLSLDSDTSPLCPQVVPVEPRQLAAINRGRRRRRSSAIAAANPAGLRFQQRRKSSRSIPLPHYHPSSLRKLDELPLSYLTEENERCLASSNARLLAVLIRYVSLDSLRRCWEDEGIERPADVLEALQIATTEETVSVEALSEVFDMEMDQNIVQKAALILYKRGISHYRAQYDHERAERCKQESNIQHLMSQIQEQEERMEKVETKHLNEKDEMELKHKNEIRLIEVELTSCQSTIKKFEMESTGKQKYIELAENYGKTQELIEDLKNENENLVKERNEMENRLHEAEDTIMKMHEDLDTSCRGMALFSREHVVQKKHLSDILRMYEAHAQSVQDHNDELLDRLQQSKKRWTSCSLDRSKSPTFRHRSSASSRFSLSPVSNHHRHDSTLGSSVSSISEIPHSPRHVSTYQFFVDDSIAPPSDLMTSSYPQITDSLGKPENLLSTDAFAFLTPSSTHARPRVDTAEGNSAIQDIHPLSMSKKIDQRTIDITSL